MMTRVARKSRSRALLEDLLRRSGANDADVSSITALGIGTAGLNLRGERDEDGTHARVRLGSGESFIYREYATTTQTSDRFRHKELAVYELLRGAGLPGPRVLATTDGLRETGRSLPASLLADEGGSALEVLLREIEPPARPALWRTVGASLRHLHDVDPTSASFLSDAAYQQRWTRFVPYFFQSLKRVKSVRPALVPAVEQLARMRKQIEDYLDSRPRSVTVCPALGGHHPPGMLLTRHGRGWTCRMWLNLGYYVSLRDPDSDVVMLAVAHREWTGAEIPSSFYDAYGSRPDAAAELIYTAAVQASRGASYLRGVQRPSGQPPPHSTAVLYLDELPTEVERLQAVLE